jgi:signal transduction histidine kinase
VRQLRKERGWLLWLAPRPFALVSSTVYLLLTSILLGLCLICDPGQGGTLIAGLLLVLLALDRIDFWLYGETPPLAAGIVFIAARLLIIEMIAQFGGVWPAMWLYGLLPYIAYLYFGLRGAYLLGALVWVVFVVRSTLPLIPIHWWDRDAVGGYVGSVVMFTFLIVFVLTMARITRQEKGSRIRAENLLAELERSHLRLKQRSEQALGATEERNRIALEIHDTLGNYLAAINVQLEKALAFRDRDGQAADQAVRDGKHLASEALHDVRRSVGSLRSPAAMTLRSPAAMTLRLLPDQPQPAGPSGEQSIDRTPAPETSASGIRKWLVPRPFDAVTATIYIGLLISDLGWGDWTLYGRPDTLVSWRSLLWVGIVLSLIAIDRLDYRLFGDVPPARAGIVLLALRFLLIVAIGFTAGWWYTIWLFPLLIYTSFTYFGNRVGYFVAALTVVGLSAMALYSALEEARYGQLNLANVLSGTVLISLMALLVVATARAVLKDRTSRGRSEELFAELEAEQQQLEVYAEQALAAAQERNHLAREIHDGLGHYLTVINVQLEKALAFREIDPEAADRSIRDARRLADEALQDVRATVGSLRPASLRLEGVSTEGVSTEGVSTEGVSAEGAFSLRPAVARLVSNMASNIAVDVQIDGKEDGFSGQSLMVLYRAVQEGLTNVQRHANARRADVRIHLGESSARLDLSDDGRGFDPQSLEAAEGERSERYGLQGVRERLELIGGSMAVESKIGEGTSLHITVPKEPLGLARPVVVHS